MTKIIPFHSHHLPPARAPGGWQASIGQSYNGIRVSTQFEVILRDGAPFFIGEWLVEPTTNRVSHGGESIQLEHKAMDLLLCLVERAGEVVSKDALFDAVWQTEFVSDNTLANRVAQLRSAFGDDVRDPCFIETIRKRGYRLIAEVRPVTTPSEGAALVPETAPSTDEEKNPYPGLSAFTEADADRFFGRETEVAALWRKISARRLLAVIGPSGVGKSSLLRAGVAARAPTGWRVVVFAPGEAPMLSLARALAPDHAGDPAAVARLLGFNDSDTALAVVSRWRGQFDKAVVVVDQFEELFTLNPPEVQASFIELLRRLVDAADVHLVLAMRDDYLYRCQQHEEIAPIFKDLTPLPPPAPEGLRRALTEPAGRQLYRFESALLVDRMIAEVEGERGALPLLAFAVHRLWEERDREDRLLTDEAYERIGGVAGALAKHADATLEHIGHDRLPIARELFRNLVTAEGTRAAREVDELLSVFPEGQRESAEEVLRELVDARLLTGYRDQADDERPMRRAEIVHESLLGSWPRLVRWQTQDADSARLRDELRQAARLWDDHERANDYLWTGKAFREFSVWRENYPGGLTALEEEFAGAMTSNAVRERRRRRVAYSAALVVLLVVLGVVAVSRQQAVTEARRAEAAKLLALGQLRLEDYPTATLAHAIASLELADTVEARRLALRALWEGPTAVVINEEDSSRAVYARDGRRLVQVVQRGSSSEGHIRVITSEGTTTLLDRVHDIPLITRVDLNPEGTVLCTVARDAGSTPHLKVVLWSLPDGRHINESRFAPATNLGDLWQGGWQSTRFLLPVYDGQRSWIYALNFDGTEKRLGPLDLDIGTSTIDHDTGHWFAAVVDNTVVLFEVGDHEVSPPQKLGRHPGTEHRIAFDPEGGALVTSNRQGLIKVWDHTGIRSPVAIDGPPGIDHLEISKRKSRLIGYAANGDTRTTWVWSIENGDARLLRVIESGPAHGLFPDFLAVDWSRSGTSFAKCGPGKVARLWSLAAPSNAEQIVLRRGAVSYSVGLAFHPSGLWLATAQMPGLTLWPIMSEYPWVTRSHSSSVTSVEFGPDGQWLASGDQTGVVNLTPLGGEVPPPDYALYEGPSNVEGLAASPDGSRILVGFFEGGATLVPLDGGRPSSLGTLTKAYGAAFSPDGRIAAASGWEGGNDVAIHIFSTSTQQELAVLEPEAHQAAVRLDEKRSVLSDGRILTGDSYSGLRVWEPTSGTSELLFEGICPQFAASADGRRIVLVEKTSPENQSPSRVVLLDLDARTQTHLARYGDRVLSIAMDAAGETVVTGDHDGVVRVGSTDGGEPHLLLGHEGSVWDVDIDPLGRWVASGSEDTTVRIWPMPDLTTPPLHTLPHDELLAKLKTLTNLRVVRDDEVPTGWTLTHDPFPGWETVPTW